MVDNGPAGLPARARDHRLRVHFPAPFPGQAIEEAVYDGHFELVRRPVGALLGEASWIEQPRPEKPQRAFTSLCHAQFGLVIANRGLPEVEVIPGAGATEIALTLMRCVGWLSRGDLSARKGHAGPMHATPGAQMPGLHTFDYAIIPHASGQDQPSSLSAYRHAFAFNTPMRAAGASLHPGELSPMASLVRVLPHAFMLSAIKTAEDGLGWIVRGYNLTAEPLQVTLVPWRPFRIAQRVDLNEQILEDLACAEDGRVSLPVSGCEIATVKFSV
jgi:alpha-mannosidase